VPEKQPRRWIKGAFKLLIVALVLGWIVHTILDSRAQLADYDWHFDLWWLVLAGLFYLVGLLPSGLFWHRVLRTLGQEAGLGETLRSYYIGHLGKYVPGKAMVIVMRAGMIRSHRVDTAVAAISILVETLTMMAVGAGLAAAILAIQFRDQVVLMLVAVALAVVSGLPTVPWVFRQMVSIVGRRWLNPDTTEKLHRLHFGALVGGWLSVAAGWGFMGLSLWATLRAMGVDEALIPQDLSLLVATVALAVVAGFLSLIPGGAGVRELVLMELMAPRFGEVNALVSALLLRLVWLVAELAISGILYFWRPRPGQ